MCVRVVIRASGQSRRLKKRATRQSSLSKDQFEGVVVDYLQVRRFVSSVPPACVPGEEGCASPPGVHAAL